MSAYDAEVDAPGSPSQASGVAGASWTAVVLAGGRSSRFGSDKVLARIGGARLVDIVVAGIPEQVPLLLVGPDPTSLPSRVQRVPETRLHGGPVSAIMAALPLIDTPLTGVIAADMPAAADHLSDLVASLGEESVDEVDACLPTDPSGRLQVLCGAYRTRALQRVLSPIQDPFGIAMHAVVTQVRVRTVQWPGAWTWDVDTPADLASGQHILAVEADDGHGDQDGEAGDRQG